MGLLDRLKALRDRGAPWSRAELDGATAPPQPEPGNDEDGEVPVPLALRIAGGVLVAAWLGWTAYATADRGIGDGIGVLVAWPTLLAMAAIFVLPFVGIGWLILRAVRGGGEDAGEDGGEDAEEAKEEPEEEDGADEEEPQAEDEAEGDEKDTVEDAAEPEQEEAKEEEEADEDEDAGEDEDEDEDA